MKLSYQVHSCGTSFRAAADEVVAMENAGLDIGVDIRIVFTRCGNGDRLPRVCTRRVQLGTSIVPIYPRTPTLLA